MPLDDTTYSTDTDVFNIDGTKAGDAVSMETKLQAVIDGDATPANIADMVLTGVEQGPEWEATLVLGAATGSVARSGTRVFAAVAGNKTSAYLKLLQRLVVGNTAAGIADVAKIEVAGGGDGSEFMALALVVDT